MMTFILGEDGRIHAGAVKMSGYLVDCLSTPGMRRVAPNELTVWGEDRMCPLCFEEENDEDEDH